MISELRENLNIAKGAWVVLLAIAGGMALAFGGRLLLTHLYTPKEYGVFSLAWIVLNISSLLALLGLQETVSQRIAFYRSAGNNRGVAIAIGHSLEGVLVTSLCISTVLFTGAPYVAGVLKEELLVSVLRAFAIALPFLAVSHLLAAIFRGFDRIKPKVIFFDLLRNGLFPLVLLPLGLLLGVSFKDAMYLFVTTYVITGVVFAIYCKGRLPRPLGGDTDITRKSLYAFSLPVLALVTTSNVIAWTDTLVLGFYETTRTVGIYNGAWTIAQLLLLPVTAIAFLFLPAATRFYEQNRMDDFKRSYTVVTRWATLLALPLLVACWACPRLILGTLFGSEYAEASNALRILSIAYALRFLIGPSYVALAAVARTKQMLQASALGVALSIGLNILLVPRWGMVGAAISTTVASAAVQGTLAVRLYQKTGVHPYGINHLQLLDEDRHVLGHIKSLLKGRR